LRIHASPPALGHRLNPPRVTAGARLGERVTRDERALRLRCEVALFLIFRTPRQEGEAVQRHVHGENDAQRGVHILELLACETEADVIHARAAVLRRHADAQQTKLGHLSENRRVEAVLAIELANHGRHLGAPPTRA
jgi:hypothetical protein